MHIAQIVLAGAPEFERKLQRVDFAALSAAHRVTLADSIDAANAADIAHVYASQAIPQRSLAGLKIPYVAPADVPRTRFTFRPVDPPRFIVSPLGKAAADARVREVPEAVEETFFSGVIAPPRPPGTYMLASYRGKRSGIEKAVGETLSRLHRFRDDVSWTLLDQPPSPADLAGVDAWVDPATDEDDYDGFVAEAVAAGKVVVATRIAINEWRLEKGRTGFLVPRHDPNELAHAILGALFKPEVARLKIEAAKQTAGKFRPRQRLRVLEQTYKTLIE